MIALAVSLVFVAGAVSPAAARDGRNQGHKKKGKPPPPPPPPVAEEPPAPEPEAPPGPWAEGVSAERKARAGELLEAGNALFLQKRYQDALDRYTEAVELWDHPAIRFNMVRCLIPLGRAVEAYDNIQSALRYGAAPLEATVYEEALNYDKLLAGQIATVEIACEQDGVTLTLDGQPLAACPGSQTRQVVPGRHQVVGTRDGFLTRTEAVFVTGGATEQVSIMLTPLSDVALVSHRWATWKPWAVFLGGVAVTGVGALLELQARSLLDTYEGQIAAQCSERSCSQDQLDTLRISEDEALRLNRIGVGVMAFGGVVAIASGVALLLNRGKTTYPDERAAVTAVPVAGGAALALRGTF